MQQVPVFEAKNKLTLLLHIIESGETVEITRHGKPIAVLCKKETAASHIATEKEDPFLLAYKNFRHSMTDNTEWTDEEWNRCFDIPRPVCNIRHQEDFI